MENIHRLYSGFKQILWARNRARKESEKLIAGIEIPIITKDQKEQIRHVWGDIHVDTKWFAYFNMFHDAGEQWSPSFVPANLHYGVVDLFYSSNSRCSVMEDKNLNNLLYSEVLQPRTILRCVKNGTSGQKLLLDADYNTVNEKTALRLLSTQENIICKPAIASGGGRNILFLNQDMSIETKLEKVKLMNDTVVQEIVKQDASLSIINPKSLNTMRLVTFITQDGEVRLLSAVLRMGVGENKLDNAHSGGIFVGIDEKGCLKKTAHNLKGGSWHVHPTSGIEFNKHLITGFQQCKESVLKLAPRFYGCSRLISWDMTVAIDGSPLLIEANMNFGGCDIPQIANGPMFGDYTERMIREVFSKKSNVIRARFV